MTGLHAAKYKGLNSKLGYNTPPHRLVQKLSCYKSICKGNSFPIAPLAMRVLRVLRDWEHGNYKLHTSRAVKSVIKAPSHSAQVLESFTWKDSDGYRSL